MIIVNPPKVLVGTPTTFKKAYILEKYAARIKELDYENYDILLVDNSPTDEYSTRLAELGLPFVRSPCSENPYDRLITARNVLRQAAISGGYDYLLSLESDVIPPKDIIKRLLSHNKEYVTTLMWTHSPTPAGTKPIIVVRREWSDQPGKFYDLRPEEIASAPLITISRSHLGCTLISANLLRQITFRHDGWQYDDYLLCDDLRHLGTTLYCDTTIKIDHFPDGSTHLEAKSYRRKQQLTLGKTL